ncbi:MAG TPA: DUF5989 family protein [Verrucomicrobiae bacterium]|nr:DUF5989 family protein [Verrucomicrobiae bacterium]
MQIRVLLNEFLDYLRANKKAWLVPTLVVLVVLAALVFFAHGTALAPFMYSH